MSEKLILGGTISVNEDGLLTKVTSPITTLYEFRELLELQVILLHTIETYKAKKYTNEKIKDINNEYRKKFWQMHDKESSSKRQKRAPRKGYVYLAQNTKTKSYKIGFSMNPESRIQTLNSASDTKIELLFYCAGVIQDEKKLHSKFKNYRLNSEWFEPSRLIYNHFLNKNSNG